MHRLFCTSSLVARVAAVAVNAIRFTLWGIMRRASPMLLNSCWKLPPLQRVRGNTYKHIGTLSMKECTEQTPYCSCELNCMSALTKHFGIRTYRLTIIPRRVPSQPLYMANRFSWYTFVRNISLHCSTQSSDSGLLYTKNCTCTVAVSTELNTNLPQEWSNFKRLTIE